MRVADHGTACCIECKNIHPAGRVLLENQICVKVLIMARSGIL